MSLSSLEFISVQSDHKRDTYLEQVITVQVEDNLKWCCLFTFWNEKENLPVSKVILCSVLEEVSLWNNLFCTLEPILTLAEKSNVHLHACTHLACIISPLFFPCALKAYDIKTPSTQFSKPSCGLLSIFTTNWPWGCLQDYSSLSSATFASWLQHFNFLTMEKVFH